jgi:hypothetical protein
MKFPRTALLEMAYHDHGDDYEVISNDIIDHSRWSVIHEMIFKYDGKFFKTSYSVGATEQQDERPYDYEGETIECKEVKPVEKTIIEYVEV